MLACIFSVMILGPPRSKQTDTPLPYTTRFRSDTSTKGSLWAVLPIKDMAAAKQRLSGALAPHERRGLFAAMAEDVLAALAAVDRFDGILLDRKSTRLNSSH